MREGIEVIDESGDSGLDFGTALDALRDGDKIRLSTWVVGLYIYLDPSNNKIYDTQGRELAHITTECFLATDWEIYND